MDTSSVLTVLISIITVIVGYFAVRNRQALNRSESELIHSQEELTNAQEKLTKAQKEIEDVKLAQAQNALFGQLLNQFGELVSKIGNLSDELHSSTDQHREQSDAERAGRAAQNEQIAALVKTVAMTSGATQANSERIGRDLLDSQTKIAGQMNVGFTDTREAVLQEIKPVQEKIDLALQHLTELANKLDTISQVLSREMKAEIATLRTELIAALPNTSTSTATAITGDSAVKPPAPKMSDGAPGKSEGL